jgi:CTP:molybdopterin cytidylyltransferase MocA
VKFCALILAGGRSARMGKVKPLLPLPRKNAGPRSALATLACLYSSAGVRDVLVVSGFHAEAVEGAARALSLAVARNLRPERGMFSSVRVGLEAAPADCDGIFVHPADVPLVGGHTLKLLIEAASENFDAVLIPCHKGRPGHPPLLPAVFREAVLEHAGGGGLRAALAGLPGREVDTPDPFILEDMDRPEDYRRIERLARIGSVP